MRYFIQFTLILLLIPATFAESIEANEFESIEQESRYHALIEDIRCPVCQGQSIGGSNSSLAKDLRKQVRQMILSNKSNKEIYQFMVERYGDFVVFKPPINWKTYFLWFSPLLFLVFCLIYLIRTTTIKDEMVADLSLNVEKAKRLLK